MKDFKAFTPVAGPGGGDEDDAADPTPSTLVLLERLDIAEDGDLVLVGIEGSHFLWKMVRRIVGVLVEIGRGGLEPEAAAEFLTTGSSCARAPHGASVGPLSRTRSLRGRRAAIRRLTPFAPITPLR